MPFITQFNASRISRQIDFDKFDVEQELFKRRIYFLSKYERAELLAFRTLVKDQEFFVEHVYTPIPMEASGKYVFEYDGQKPSYHELPTCVLLHRDFQNIQISEALRERLIERNVSLKAFRAWAYEELLHLFHKRDWEAIVFRIGSKFRVPVSRNDVVQYDNSDAISVENMALDELEHKIDRLIANAGRYYYDHPEILKQFSKISFLYKKKEPIEGNDTGLDDMQLKAFLKDYHARFKRPLIYMLKQWYMVSFNPDLEFKGNLLDQLNFKPCSKCKDSMAPPGPPFETVPSIDSPSSSAEPKQDDDWPF